MTVPKPLILLTAFVASKFSLGLQQNKASRRAFLTKQASFVSTTLAVGSGLFPKNAAALQDPSFRAFEVIPDAGPALNPSLVSVDEGTFYRQVLSSTKNGGALWLGEHHNAKSDHALQTRLIQQIHRRWKGPIAVGLEQVQVQFQPVLDDFYQGRIEMEEMKRLVEWDKRWSWPFDVYEPVFATAKELHIPLIALNVNSEDLALVEQAGLPNLPRQVLQSYIADGQGFADFAKFRDFSTYVDYVIRPSYELHDAMGLLQYTMSGQKLDERMSFRNFFSARILWDEAMASRAHQWTSANPHGLLVGLVGADHVKFRDGIPGRYARLAGTSKGCSSVMLNPTLIDTRPSGSVASIPMSDSSLYPERITLQLRYLKEGVDVNSPDRMLPSSTGGVLPLADYIILS